MDKPLILIVEDEVEYSLEIEKDIQSAHKYETAVANSAEEALNTLKKNKGFLGLSRNKVRCILLDIKMPGMDGLQFLEMVRKDFGDDIGVIMITAYEDEEKWDRALGGAVAGYLKKPYDRQELFDLLSLFFSEDNDGANRAISKAFTKGVDRINEFREGKAP